MKIIQYPAALHVVNATIDHIAWLELVKNGCGLTPTIARSEFIKPELGFNINPQRTLATVVDTVTGIKNMVRNTLIAFPSLFTNIARNRAMNICTGLIISVNRSVTLNDFQNVGSWNRNL